MIAKTSEEKTVLIKVNREDIRKGQSGDFNYCAIELALLRAFPGSIHAGWGFTHGTVNMRRTHSISIESLAPKKTTKFVREHDEKKRIKPISFRAKTAIRTIVF
jgi:hypothetical protein